MTQHLDYSQARPGGAAIQAAGYGGVIRYVSPEPVKNLTPEERDDLRAHGLSIALVWEDAATNALAGTAQGQADAMRALQQARSLGYPDDCTIFFAVDFDMQPTQATSVCNYFRGAEGVIGHARTGSYAPYDGLQALHVAGLCTRYWQAYAPAWSQGRNGGLWAGAALRQSGGQAFNGGADINNVLGPYGAWEVDDVTDDLARAFVRMAFAAWNRVPDQAGIDYWVGQLHNPGVTADSWAATLLDQLGKAGLRP